MTAAIELRWQNIVQKSLQYTGKKVTALILMNISHFLLLFLTMPLPLTLKTASVTFLFQTLNRASAAH